MSYETLLSEAVRLFVKGNVISPIVEHLEEKGVKVTSSELMKVIKFPSLFTEPGVRSRKTENKTSGEKCQYIFTRGRISEGKKCNSDAIEGTFLCKKCSTKARARDQLIKRGVISSGEETVKTPKKSKDSSPVTKEPIAVNCKIVEDGFVVEKYNNLLIRPGPNPKQQICIGTYDFSEKKIDPLTEEDIVLCKELNISYVPNWQETEQDTEDGEGVLFT